MRSNLLKSMILSACLGATLLGAYPSAAAEPNAGEFFTCVAPLGLSEGKQIANEVQTNYRKVSSLQGNFLQFSYLSSLDEEQQSAGMVWFLRPGKMRWSYRTPDEQEFVIRDNTVWFYQRTDNQLLIDQFDKVLLSDLPVAFLSGVGDLDSSFTLNSACRASSSILLDFTPKNTASGKELQNFKLKVDATRKLPVGAQVVDVSGNVTSIALSSVKTDSSTVQDSLFSLELPAGVDVNDRRPLKKEKDLTLQEGGLHG